MLMPKLSFSAVDIDSFITVPTLLMYVVAAGSNMPILYIFRFQIFFKKLTRKSEMKNKNHIISKLIYKAHF